MKGGEDGGRGMKEREDGGRSMKERGRWSERYEGEGEV